MTTLQPALLDAVVGLRLDGIPVEALRPPPCVFTPSGWRPDAVLPRRPIVLDAFCGRGGSSLGWYAAGWDVVGIDLDPQPLYPFEFHQGDGIAFVRAHGHLFDAVHGGPPCQRFSRLRHLATLDYPRLIAPFRDACQATGRPYVIENVEDARDDLHDPVTLCMSMWARRMYRHRLFESNVPLLAPPHPPHRMRQAKLGRPARSGEAFQVAGNFPQIAAVRRQMEMPWSDRRGIAESAPPVLLDYVARQVLARLIDQEAGVAA